MDDESILPKVELSDVPASLPELEYTQNTAHGIDDHSYAQGTNGLVYQQAVAHSTRSERRSNPAAAHLHCGF